MLLYILSKSKTKFEFRLHIYTSLSNNNFGEKFNLEIFGSIKFMGEIEECS